MKYLTTLLLAITILFSCSGPQKKENILVGDWQVIDLYADAPGVEGGMIAEAKKEVVTRKYSIRDDGTLFFTTTLIPKGQKGKWEYITDKKFVILDYPPGSRQSKEQYQVEMLDDNSMRWTQHLSEGRGSLSMILKKEE